jgi:hypothetical protein
MRTVIVTAVLLLAPLVVRANTELTIKSERTTIPVKSMQRNYGDKGPPTNQTIHLTLGARWMQWDDGSNQEVYDFVKSVDISVDLKAHRLVEVSLYAALSGRAAELDNRLMLGRVLEAGKVENNPMAGTMAEHQLSLRHDVRPSGIERKTGNGEQRYLWQEKELFAYSRELVPLPAAARDLYIRFVRYTVGGHPEILDDLQKLDGIPKWLRYSDPAFGDARRLEVIETKETPDAPYALPKLEKATMNNREAAAAAAIVMASTPESRAAVTARILAAANSAVGEGRPLEAILGYLEYHLMNDGGLPPDFKIHKDVLTRDQNVKALLGAIHAENEEQAKACIATLARLALIAGDKAYIVGIFRADMEGRLGNKQTETSLLVAALTKNPFITGVWKDLGDSLNTGYDAADTWRCYEIARLIVPTHSLLADVVKRETSMAKEHAEFF